MKLEEGKNLVSDYLACPAASICIPSCSSELARKWRFGRKRCLVLDR